MDKDIEILKEKILRLKEEKDVLILAHFYANSEVQDIADKVGDSFKLAKDAQNANNKIICFCGVNFMGESAKLLNPDKKILIPDINAGCAMADMVNLDDIDRVREKYEDLAIVSYINTKADVKSKSDVCVTSSNAMKIVSALPNKNIYFLPYKNLGSYIADKMPDKNFIFHEGYCKYHNFVDYEEVRALKEEYGYDVLVHPECTSQVVSLGDCVGSTKALLDYVEKTKKLGYIVCTEEGILYQMNKVSPDSEFIIPRSMKPCGDMKKNSLENLYRVLLDEGPEIILDEAMMERASLPLKKMMEMS